MSQFRTIADIRRDYGDLSLPEDSVHEDPIVQFNVWFVDVLNHEIHDPTAMVLSTVDDEGKPDSRVVLLKGLEAGHFIFYSNYQSTKALQMERHPFAALNFYWPQMARQVRVRGSIQKISPESSDQYFLSRPILSQLSAIVSPQSKEIPSREFLERALEDLNQNQAPIVRPDTWGGYMLIPQELEFWQGRDNRLHDRIHYFQKAGIWQYHRLAP